MHANILETYRAPQLYTTGRELFGALENAIRAARKEILISMYECNGDATGRQFVRLLKEAAQRGIKIKLLLDNIELLPDTIAFINKELASAGAHVIEFRPLRAWFPRRPLAAACRNHARFILIDESIFGCGGMSFNAVCLDRPDLFTLLAVADEPATRLKTYFDGLCKLASLASITEPLAFDNATPLAAGYAPLTSGPEARDQEIYRWLSRSCDSATERIIIGSPFFFPDTPLVKKLIAAQQRGVAVEVITPLRSDKPRYDWFRAVPIPKLVKRGVRWYGARSYFHSKFCIVDDAWTFGSANMDIFGAQRNYELNVCGKDPRTLAGLLAHAEELKSDATDIFHQPMPRHIRVLIKTFHRLTEYIFKLT